jgi:hypothetical protein
MPDRRIGVQLEHACLLRMKRIADQERESAIVDVQLAAIERVYGSSVATDPLISNLELIGHTSGLACVAGCHSDLNSASVARGTHMRLEYKQLEARQAHLAEGAEPAMQHSSGPTSDGSKMRCHGLQVVTSEIHDDEIQGDPCHIAPDRYELDNALNAALAELDPEHAALLQELGVAEQITGLE